MIAIVDLIMLSKHELYRRSNGLSGVGMECACSSKLSGGD